MSLSVVIRTKNSGQTLKKCLESLSNQVVSPKEIIVVDSGSTDNTLEIANKYDCKIVHYPLDVEFNYSKALNLGIEVATGKYIMIVSSHVSLKYSNTSALMLSFLASWDTICAVSIDRDTVEDISETFESEQTRWTLINRHNFERWGMFNFCSLIRRETWQNYHFNEQLPRCEDQDWVLNFYKKNNAASIIIWEPKVFYKNPYYNAKKDAWDYITLGHHINHYFISKSFVKKMIVQALKSLFRMRLENATHSAKIALYIILDRLGKTNVQSVYSRDQEEVKNEL